MSEVIALLAKVETPHHVPTLIDYSQRMSQPMKEKVKKYIKDVDSKPPTRKPKVAVEKEEINNFTMFKKNELKKEFDNLMEFITQSPTVQQVTDGYGYFYTDTDTLMGSGDMLERYYKKAENKKIAKKLIDYFRDISEIGELPEFERGKVVGKRKLKYILDVDLNTFADELKK